MSRLADFIMSDQFKTDWEKLEQDIVNDFGTVSFEELHVLYARLHSARDLYNHLREVYNGKE